MDGHLSCCGSGFLAYMGFLLLPSGVRRQDICCDDCHVCMRELLATRVVSSNRLSRGTGGVVCPVAVVLFADQPGAWHTVGGLRPRPFSIPLPQSGSMTLVLQTVL